MECETPTSEFLAYRNFYGNKKCFYLSLAALFGVYILWIVLEQSHVYKCENNSRRLTEAFHVLYYAKLDDKCEIKLKD